MERIVAAIQNHDADLNKQFDSAATIFCFVHREEYADQA
jgi:hypothetical protein